MNIEEAIETLKNAFKCNKKQFEELGTHILLQDDEQEYLEWQKNADIILNLIEKQQKEIEELKDINKKLEARKYMLNARTGEVTAIPIDNNYISKDKIEAKIEEINKEMLNEENSLELFYRKKYCKEVLQSLLEKE